MPVLLLYRGGIYGEVEGGSDIRGVGITRGKRDILYLEKGVSER